MAERKLVVVQNSGILTELGGIGGPITTPTRIPLDAILKMINNQRTVLECYPNDPRNEELRVKLTQANYKSNNFEHLINATYDTKSDRAENTPVANSTAPETPVETPVEAPQEPVDDNVSEVAEAPVESPVEPVETVVENTPVENTTAPETPVETPVEAPQEPTKNETSNSKSNKKKK